MKKLITGIALCAFTAVQAVEIIEVNQTAQNTMPLSSPVIATPPAPVIVTPAVPQQTQPTQPAIVNVHFPEPLNPSKNVRPSPNPNITEVRDVHVEVVDGVYEHVDTTTIKKETRPVQKEGQPVAASAAAVATAVAATKESVVEVLQEPPESEAADPKRLLHYFCNKWKDGDYDAMWWSMSLKFRMQTKKEEFVKLFAADALLNGGLDDEMIESGSVVYYNQTVSMVVKLTFKYEKIAKRKVKVVMERTKNGWRISDGGIVPIDLTSM